MADLVADYLTRLPDGPAYQPPPRGLVEDMRAAEWAEQGEPADAILAEFTAHVAPYPFGNGHPGFAAWVNSPPHPLGVLAEALAAAMDPSVAGGNHAAVHLEHQVIRWFAGLLGWPGGYSGQLVSGGSAATLTALAVARHGRGPGGARRPPGRAGRPGGPPGALHGDQATAASPRRPKYSASARPRFRWCPPTRITGCGRTNSSAWCWRPGGGKLAVAVVATAGTTNTGAIDPLGEIAGVWARYGLWLHVDGAYGVLPILLLDRYQTARDGLARADSLAVDAYGGGVRPVDAGLVLLRDCGGRDTFNLVRVPADRRRRRRAGGPVWFSEYGPSRRAVRGPRSGCNCATWAGTDPAADRRCWPRPGTAAGYRGVSTSSCWPAG